jgi:hypothetical protein
LLEKSRSFEKTWVVLHSLLPTTEVSPWRSRYSCNYHDDFELNGIEIQSQSGSLGMANMKGFTQLYLYMLMTIYTLTTTAFANALGGCEATPASETSSSSIISSSVTPYTTITVDWLYVSIPGSVSLTETAATLGVAATSSSGVMRFLHVRCTPEIGRALRRS